MRRALIESALQAQEENSLDELEAYALPWRRQVEELSERYLEAKNAHPARYGEAEDIEAELNKLGTSAFEQGLTSEPGEWDRALPQ